jgi:hypothetical protein
MFSIGTPLSLMIDTKECRSSRGVQFSPRPARLVIDLNARRLDAARWHGPDVLCRASLDAGKRLAQRVKTHRAQAERLGVKVLEAEGSSGPCHGILPGL